MPGRRAEYELVPSTDDPNAPPSSEKPPPAPRSRRSKLILLALAVVLLLTVLYRYWFSDADENGPSNLPQDDSKEGQTPTSTSFSEKPTQQPSEGNQGDEETMPSGKYSVG